MLTFTQYINEEKIAILTSVYKSVKKDMDKLMKKHDAYVSDTFKQSTTISSPKPMGAFIKDVQKLIGLKESINHEFNRNI
jgi:tryptophan synthase beta subunit